MKELTQSQYDILLERMQSYTEEKLSEVIKLFLGKVNLTKFLGSVIAN